LEELPEKKAPQSQPESEQTEAETTPVAGGAGETAPQQAGEDRSSETSPVAEQAAQEQLAKQSGQGEEAEGGGDVSGSTTAASGSDEEANPEKNVEAAEQPEQTEGETPEAPAAPVAEEAAPQPAAETGTPPDAQVDTSAAAEGEGEDIQVTASGAVMVPGEEAPRAEEPRPKKAPARPEKPTGPRISDLRPGQVVEGTVTRIEKYGAFVNLGLADRRDGLIHISELAPHRIRRVEDVVQVGEPVRARVVTVDLARGRIALSLNDVDAETSKEASVGPAEPSMTSMEMAFRDAQNRQRERESREKGGGVQGKVGDKKRREQEELMRRLGSSQ
jgi:predicted RNA-binding protein with RPS1 domain